MYKINRRDCKPYLVHGEASEVCILGPVDRSLNLCNEPPGISCANGILFFNWAKLPPGKNLEKHFGEYEEIYYIISGNGLITVDDEVAEITDGDAIYIPSGVGHGMSNPGKTSIEYIVLGSTSK